MRTPSFVIGGIVALGLVAGGAIAASTAQADPNVETVLPANGVNSIERVGNVWTVTMSGPPSEVKVMTPDLGPQCGVNYADKLGLCSSIVTFTAPGPCVYIQVDGIPYQNSSDPFVCRNHPTSTPGETTWPTGSSPATTSPATTPNASSTSVPPDLPAVTPTSSVSSTTGATSENAQSSAPPVASDAQRTLAATGTNALPIVFLVVLAILVGAAVVVNGRRS